MFSGPSRHRHRPPAPRASWPENILPSLRDRYAPLDRPILAPRSALARVKGPQNQGPNPKPRRGVREEPAMNETTITLTGNLVDNPELRFTPARA